MVVQLRETLYIVPCTLVLAVQFLGARASNQFSEEIQDIFRSGKLPGTTIQGQPFTTNEQGDVVAVTQGQKPAWAGLTSPLSLSNEVIDGLTTVNTGQYLKPYVVLTDRHTISSGEGIALGCTKNPRCETVGLEGTYGSFGMMGGNVQLSNKVSVGYPNGVSLDPDKKIQLDSKLVDGKYVGGVHPTKPIPRTPESVDSGNA